MKKAIYACHMLILFSVNEDSIEVIELLIDDFTCFGDGFSDIFGNSSCMQKMKDERVFSQLFTTVHS